MPRADTESGSEAETVVLVEGNSDRDALRVLATRTGIDLVSAGIEIVAMGGATNVAAFTERLCSADPAVRLIGLCDASETRFFASVLDEYYICRTDLEDELLRALGVDRVVAFIEAEGELGTFRTMQRQPAQRDRTVAQQLHRFCGVRSGRKRRYAAGLAAELALDDLPQPLDDLIDALAEVQTAQGRNAARACD